MYLHEYQSKNLLRSYNIFVPKSFLIDSLDDVKCVSNIFNTKKLVLKAQIHSGNRAEFGGVVFVYNEYTDLYNNVSNLLGSKISTNQTMGEEKVIKKILIEEHINFTSSFYMSLFIDISSENICFLISKTSGSDIEHTDECNFFKLIVEPLFGIMDYHIKFFLKKLNLDSTFFLKVNLLLNACLDIFISCDLILLEVNPLVLYDNNFFCLDAKIEIDDNSLFRQSSFTKLHDDDQYNFLENEAKKFNLSYISLDGNIGCIVNGAGLAMATMDLIKMYGGMPANFLDIGGDATEDKVLNAVRIILLNKNVSCMFVNIFGGIVKCDSIAKSIVNSISVLNIDIPIVVRFIGSMANEAVNIINESKKNVSFEEDFYLAVEKVISFSKSFK